MPVRRGDVGLLVHMSMPGDATVVGHVCLIRRGLLRALSQARQRWQPNCMNVTEFMRMRPMESHCVSGLKSLPDAAGVLDNAAKPSESSVIRGAFIFRNLGR
jgi:hypothetical protein